MGGYYNKESIGRFEAMQTAKSALTGHKYSIDIRAQQLGSPTNAFKKVEAFTPRQSRVRDEALTVRGQIEHKLSIQEQQQFLKTIEAKQRSLGVKTERLKNQQQAEVQQAQVELQHLAQEIPAAIAMGPTALLLVWILKKLPNRIYKIAAAMTILSMALAACTSVSIIPNSENPNQSSPVPGETVGLPDSPTGEAEPVITSTVTRPTSTVTPAPTETQVVSQVEQFLAAHLAGESIDVSSLSPTEFREFSTQLAEQRNAERGVNPVIYNGEAYLDPNSYRLMDYDGHPDMNETIQMYLPVVGKDSAGNLQIRTQGGQTVTIANSADVDWNMVVTDPNDPRIDWPNLPKTFPGGLSLTEAMLSGNLRVGDSIFIVPTILLDKQMGAIFMEGEGKGFVPLFRFLTAAETDTNGVPIVFRLSLMIANTTQLTIEDSDLQVQSHGLVVSEQDPFYINLQENSVYYMGMHENQNSVWDLNYNTNMDAYQGLIADNEITSILTHQEENSQDLMLLPPPLLIQKK